MGTAVLLFICLSPWAEYPGLHYLALISLLNKQLHREIRRIDATKSIKMDRDMRYVGESGLRAYSCGEPLAKVRLRAMD